MKSRECSFKMDKLAEVLGFRQKSSLANGDIGGNLGKSSEASLVSNSSGGSLEETVIGVNGSEVKKGVFTIILGKPSGSGVYSSPKGTLYLGGGKESSDPVSESDTEVEEGHDRKTSAVNLRTGKVFSVIEKVDGNGGMISVRVLK